MALLARRVRGSGQRPGAAGDDGHAHWLSLLGGGKPGAPRPWLAGLGPAAADTGRWLAGEGPPGLALVTGGPGTGKSAVLASLALASSPPSRDWVARAAARDGPVRRAAAALPAGLALVAADAHGLTADQVARQLAPTLGRTGTTAAALLEDLATEPETAPWAVIIDAADEAVAPVRLVQSLLAPLARQSGWRVLLATTTPTPLGIGDAGPRFDLGPARDTAGAPGPRAAGTPGHAVAGAPRPGAELVRVFEAHLTALGERAPAARLAARALAWANGPGLPRALWPLVARELADGGPPLTGAQLRWAAGQLSAHLVTDTSPVGGELYRLRHTALADYLRDGTRHSRRREPGGGATSPGDGHSGVDSVGAERQAELARNVTGALLTTVPAGPRGRDWSRADAYQRAYLGQHAADAGPGTLTALVTEPGFIAAADPATLGPLLSFGPPELADLSRAYRRALPTLGEDAGVNAACLAEAMVALAGPAAGVSGDGTGVAGAGGDGEITPPYRTRLASARRDDTIVTLNGHTYGVAVVAFGHAPDGRLLLASGSDDQTVRIWDPLLGTPVRAPLTGHSGWVDGVAFSPPYGGRTILASAASDATIRLWDAVTGQPLGEPLTGHTGWVISVAFATVTGSDGAERLLLASGSADHTVRLWDPLTREPLGEPLTGHTGWVISVAFGMAAGPGGEERPLLASGSCDTTARIWDPLTGQPLGPPLAGHTGWVDEVSFAHDPAGRLLLATGGSDRTARLWDPLTGTRVAGPFTHDSELSSVTLGEVPGGGLLLAAGCDDSTIWVWDALTGTRLGEPLSGHLAGVHEVAFAAGPGGRMLLASAGNDHSVRIWDPPLPGTAAGRASAAGATRWVDAVAFSGDTPALMLASGSGDKTVRLWDPVSGEPVGAPLTGHTDTVHAVAFTAMERESDGERAGGLGGDGARPMLASASADRTIRIWDPRTGAAVGAPLTGHTEAVREVTFLTAPGRWTLLASAGDDRTVRLWDPLAGEAVGPPLAHPSWVDTLAFATVAGRGVLATGGGDGLVRLWDPLTGELVCEPLRGHSGPVRSLAFGATRGGAPLLASAGDDRTIRRWDPGAAAPAGPALLGHRRWVSAVAFLPAPDGGTLLVSGGGDRAVRIWHPASGDCLLTLPRRTPVRSLAAAGALLAIGDDEGLTVIELSPLTARRRR